MLLFYRRRGIVEVLKVLLHDNFSRSLLHMPVHYTSLVPAPNADTHADDVSFELSSPVCPSKIVTFSLHSSKPTAVVSAKRCHSNVHEDTFDVRMVCWKCAAVRSQISDVVFRNRSLLVMVPKFQQR